MSAATTPFHQRTALDLLRTAVFGGEPVTAAEMQAANFAPAIGVIDPVALAAEQSDPRYLAASQAIRNAITSRRQRQLDPASAAIDLLSQRAGLPTNLSGFRKDPRLFYPIAPGVTYETDLQPSRLGGRGGEVEYIRFADTPMMDWDIPDDIHAARNVSVRHLGDVEELVQEHLRANPQSSLALYQTPGGYRAWELSQQLTPQQFARQAEQLHVDPDYITIAQQGNPQLINDLPVNTPGFSARVSAKPGRSTDWVAQPIAVLEGRESIPNPTNVRRVRQYHDGPIRKAFLGDSGINPHALELLNTQARTASPALRRLLGSSGLLR